MRMHTHPNYLHRNANHQDVYFILRLGKGVGTDNFTKEPKRDGQDYMSWCMNLGLRKSCSVSSARNFEIMAMSAHRFQIQVPKIRSLLLI